MDNSEPTAGEPSVRRSKRLEDRQRTNSEDLSKRGKKRKISSPIPPPDSKSKYKLRRSLRSPSPNDSSRIEGRLGNTKSTPIPSLPNSPTRPKSNPDGSSTAGSSSMSNVPPSQPATPSDSTTSSFHPPQPPSSAASTTGEGGTTPEEGGMNSPDDDIARLQNLLEARGVPPHVLSSFGSRMHLFLNRSSSTMSHAQQLLTKLQSRQEAQQLDACVELCQMLVMGNEETLAGFPVRQAVPLLISLLGAEENMHLMLQACRALTYIMESLPRSANYVVEAVPYLLSKLKSIQCMDVAEQALAALDMLSKKHSKSILQAGGLSACLCFIDFFSLNAQRSALNITANCCQVVTVNDGQLFLESVPVLITKLNTQDKKLLESCCLTFSRLVEQLKGSPHLLMELCKDGLITNLQQLLLVSSPSVMTSNVFTMILRILSTVFQHRTSLATEFIKQDASGTIRSLLLGNKTPVDNPTLIHRSSSELFEILCLCAELLPQLPKYGVFSVDTMISGIEEDKHRQWYYKDPGTESWQPFSKPDNKSINNGCGAGESDIQLTLKLGATPSTEYTVDLSTMKMENEETGEMINLTSSRKRALMTDLLHGKEKEKEDCRLTLLNEEPALYDELCETMLLLLFEVYRTSATPNVKYQCLHCLLRIIYHSRADTIRTMSETLPLSSTVAGMLTSQDSRLVVYGLQLSEILMKKQPTVFAVCFKREGVMHAVKKILTETASPAIPGRSNIECRGMASPPSRGLSHTAILPPLELEPRTTRARAKAGESSSSTLPGAEGDSSLSRRLENAWKKRKKPTPLKKSYKGKLGNCPSPPSCASGMSTPTKDDLQQWVRHQADKFCQKYLVEDTEGGAALDILTKAVLQLSCVTETTDAELPLKQIKSLLQGDTCNGNLSSFELLHAGLVETLLKFLTPQPSDRETDVLQRVSKLLEVFAFNDNNDFDPAPFSSLFHKVQQCLSQVEHFPVKVTEGTADSLSKVATTYQIKCLFRRHTDNSSSSLRQWGAGTVKVDPLAYVQALERYLLSRGYCREEEEEEEGDSSGDASEDEERIVSRQQNTPSKHRLTLTINNHPLPYNMTMYQAIKRYGTHTRLDDDAHPASHSAVWHNIHTIVYKTYESSDRVRSSAVKSAEDDPPPSSLLEKLGSAPPLLLEGYKGIGVIQLLHILHTISHEWILLLKTDDYNHPILNKDLLVNKQIAAKAERQLQDPLVIMTAEYPKWFTPLPYYTPFLFPFDVRLELLHATSFDRDRALQRLLELHPELGTSSENRSGIRLDKDKRCVDRESVFEQGRVIMSELASSISLLEVYYVGEVGTGLGPTLEFYTLLSQAFQETRFGMWRECGTYEIGEKTYVTAPLGLYPRAVSQTDSPALKSLCDNFMFLGRVIGKAIIDNRILDINLSEPFYRWLLGTHEKMGLVTIKDIDEVLHSSLKQIEVFALKKDAILKREDVSEEERTELISQITDDDGGTLEDYCLDFILPGSDVELSPGGRNTALTIHNVEDYLCAVVNFTLKEGVRKQMDAVRTGFSSVMPLSNLQLFYANEMKILLCGTAEEKWSEEELKTAIQPDHGYNSQSSAVLFLIQVMSALSGDEQRSFLQFVTGCPKLPVGGFRALHPRFTVVKKSVDGSPDDYLPSVMTCVNYLKLPDYSTAERLREKLLTAVQEGQNSFHLS